MPPKGFQETNMVGHFSWMQGMSNLEMGQERLPRSRTIGVETISTRAPHGDIHKTPQNTVLYPAPVSPATYSVSIKGYIWYGLEQ
jgi:hypothetical protein